MKKLSKSRILILILTFALIVSNFMGLGYTKVAYAETYLLEEGFDGGTTAPAGWTFTGVGTYTTSGNYGAASPSLKFDSTGDTITTSTFSNPSKLLFWIKGQSTDANSSLKVEQYDGTTWTTLEEIKPLPATGTIKTYDLSINTIQIKFTYTKSAGNLAFDDVIVTRAETAPIAVESVSLDQTNLSLNVNATYKLTPIISPTNAANKNVSWSSSNTGVATVGNDGTVTGVSEGNATITVTTEDGGKTATCDVTVTSQVHVTRVILDQHEKTLNVGKTFTLTPTIEPEDATVKTVAWSSSDETVAKVTNGQVQALKEGNAIITVTTDDGNLTDTCLITVPPIPELSIAEARGINIGEYVTVNGIVTFIDVTSGGINYYIQDDTAAIDIFVSGATTAAFNIGDSIKATGHLSQYKGLLEVSPKAADVSLLSRDNDLPAPKIITIPDANSENYESQLVKIQNVTMGTINTSGNTQITDSSNNTINIYKIPALTDIKAGDTVDVTAVVSQYSSANPPSGGYQLRVRDASNIVKVELPDTTAPEITHTPVTSGNTGADLKIEASITDDKAVSTAKVYYRTKGDTEYKSVNMSATANPNEYSATIKKEELNVSGLQYYIEATDGANKATYPADISNPIEVAITAEDILSPEVTELTPESGAYTGDVLRPVISAKYSDASGIDTSSVILTLDGVDVTSKAAVTAEGISYVPDADLANGQHLVTLTVKDKASMPQTAVVTWNFYVGRQVYNLYFGQFHSHTNYSDGQGTPTEAYAWARDNGKADFFAITDHSNSFDNDKANENITDISQSTSTEWKNLHTIADSFNEDGKFIAIAGFEMTWSGSTGGWGHINTFNTPWFASRNNSEMDLKTYYSKIGQDQDSISQLNHPGTTFGDFNDFSFWTPEADRVVNLIEVGNGEGPVRGSGYFPSYEYYTRALDKGWHVAPTNNQDNHKGNWITANDARTVILASELTRNNIYDAIRNKRVYATEDKNLRIMYTVNGKVMGSTLSNPEKLDFVVEIDDPDASDKIGKVSIISDGGKVVDYKTFDSNTAVWSLTLDPKYSYYYIRVDEADTDIAVTAPVWTGEVTPVGISKVEVSQNPQIVNTPTDVTATIYNNGTTSLSNITVEFFKNSIAPENKIGEKIIASVAAADSGTATITWTPAETGDIKVYAQSVINVNGLDKTFTGSTSILVANEKDIIKVVIDGGHYNQYVTGDYSGKILTLASMLKEKNIMLIQNNDELTASDLENVRLLIITDPQSKDDTRYNLFKSNFTNAEINVIKDFVNGGGSLIITSRADYNDKGVTDLSYQSSVQGNRILEEIGSNLRFNDDEIIDDTSNGGQNYRLYFDDYTGSKYGLTDNIPSGQTYSAYSGCSVILKSGGSDERVDWLVKGHDTTETLDSDLQNDAIPVQKGNVYSLAAEILPNGSKIIVSGTTYFSDFETAAVDNAYSNKLITDNTITWLTALPPAVVKTIAEVRVDDDKNGIPDLLGQRFAVEGIVTAESKAASTNNAFFDVIYVQDATGGITVFGVSQMAIPLGVKVRVTGILDQYEGDAEIQILKEDTDIEILDSNPAPVEPKVMSTKDSMLEENEGWLVKIQGTVKRIAATGGDNSLYIDDGSGEAKVYVNGYIGDGTDNPDMLGKWDPSIKVGDTVSAAGLASEDAGGHRIRVRNTAEIVKIASAPPATLSEVTIAASSTTLERTRTGNITVSGKMSDGSDADLTGAEISYFSSNPDVASVSDSGLITANKVGSADVWVTVKLKDKTVESNRLSITVTQLTLAPVSMEIVQASPVVDAGAEAAITLKVKDAVDLYGFDILFKYDTELFELKNIEVKNGMDLGQDAISFGENGQIRIVGALKGSPAGLDGAVELVKLTFMAKDKTELGTFTILKGTQLSDSKGALYTLTDDVTSCIAVANADITGDGVKLDDLVIVANAFGKKSEDSGYNADYDMNKDGVIDIVDIAYVMKKILGK